MNQVTIDKPGVYAIVNLENGKHYIGSTRSLKKRSKEHAYDLSSERHSSRILQNAWNKYGADAFRFDIIEVVEDVKEVLLEREQFWIDQTIPYYNVARKAHSRAGIKCSEETIQKIREAKQNISDETREKIGAASRAMWEDEELRQKLVEAAKNRPPISDETREKLAEAGRNLSEENREKKRVAAAQRRHSKESIEKMREIHKGKVISEGQREKLRQANLGKTHSEETKQKMRESHAKRRAEKLAKSQQLEKEESND